MRIKVVNAKVVTPVGVMEQLACGHLRPVSGKQWAISCATCFCQSYRPTFGAIAFPDLSVQVSVIDNHGFGRPVFMIASSRFLQPLPCDVVIRQRVGKAGLGGVIVWGYVSHTFPRSVYQMIAPEFLNLRLGGLPGPFHGEKPDRVLVNSETREIALACSLTGTVV